MCPTRASGIEDTNQDSALQANKCIDPGKIHFTTLVPVFEKIFNTSLGNYYRTFLEISIRKTGRTKFLG
jgi:hypothetical protein